MSLPPATALLPVPETKAAPSSPEALSRLEAPIRPVVPARSEAPVRPVAAAAEPSGSVAARAASAEPADPASGGACAADQQPPAAAGTQEAAAAARNDPLVEKIIALFDGALINVRKQK